MSAPKNIQTRILLLSDTHSLAPNTPTAASLPCRWPLASADVAIHTGDLTLTGKLYEHEQAIDLLKRLRADLKIVIPGNHDLTLDASYYAEKGHLHGPRPRYDAEQLQQIRDLYTGFEAQAANVVYLEEGTRTFRLKNGASLTVYASAYTPEFCEWAFAYERDQDRFNGSEAENPVTSYVDENKPAANLDVMLTHGPPFGILDKVDNRHGGGNLHVGCEHLLRAVARAKPLMHCFGHIHEGWGAVRKPWPQGVVEETQQQQQQQQPSPRKILADCSPIPVDWHRTVKEMGVFVDATDLKRGSETLFVNSSIMDLQYKGTQAPWVVDLMLSKAE